MRSHNIPEQPLSLLPSKELYGHNMRTVHKEINPPKDRLSNFRSRTVIKDNKINESDKSFELRDTSISPIPNNRQGEVTPEIKGRYSELNKSSDLSTMVNKTTAVSRILDRDDSIEGRSSFVYYQPKDPKEQMIERLWFANKNKIVENKRVSMEFNEAINKWGHAKSRLNKEVTRKHENLNYSSNFGVRNFINKRLKLIKSMEKNGDYSENFYDESSDEEAEETQENVISKSYQTKAPEITDLTESIKIGRAHV